MKIQSNVKAGLRNLQHNQTASGMRVKSKVQAGGRSIQHNQPVR
jgi:uncharacterized membrane protein